MNDSQMTNEGLNGGLRQSHQAINLCIMTTLITLAASAEMIFDDQMVSFRSNLTIFIKKKRIKMEIFDSKITRFPSSFAQ